MVEFPNFPGMKNVEKVQVENRQKRLKGIQEGQGNFPLKF